MQCGIPSVRSSVALLVCASRFTGTLAETSGIEQPVPGDGPLSWGLRRAGFLDLGAVLVEKNFTSLASLKHCLSMGCYR